MIRTKNMRKGAVALRSGYLITFSVIIILALFFGMRREEKQNTMR